jgi:geranylgeranyl diphosphate synthase type I
MDNDELRHGTATVHQSFGIPLAIIAGDILFSKAFEMLSLHTRKVGISESAATEMIARLSMASIEICEGQAMDAGQASGGKFPSEAQYIEMIRKKTAALFTVSCALGALSSPNASTEDIDRLSVFGKNIGIAFQLVDDLIGIAGDPKLTGKAAGNDLREGKKTLPILLSIQKAKGGDRDKIMKVFASKDASQADISKAVAVITELGIDEKVRKEAAQYMHSALKSIYSFPDSAAKRSLNSLAEFVVGRSL